MCQPQFRKLMSSIDNEHPIRPDKLRPGAAMLLGALGVVFGDIGTSPLYAIKVSLSGFASLGEHHILGVLSLLFWLLRSEEHTSELQSLMRISYAVFCLKKK